MINLTEKLRDKICHEFEQIEREASSNASFVRKAWSREDGGGGVMSLMRGKIFEKVGVNICVVHGCFSKDFASQIPHTDENGTFWATGISLVAHMKSPMIPAIHMNNRMISTSKSWFGGGVDMTPIFPELALNDTDEFFDSLKTGCNKHDKTYYEKFKKACDDYFFLHHRQEPRGVGGLFYDYLEDNDKNFAFIREMGEVFLATYPKIVRKNMHKTWTNQDRERQLYKRGRYVEFNLLYDRGTTFGLKTGGNIEAILMSLPPEVKW